MNRSKKNSILITLVHFTFNMAFCIYFGFIVSYLKDKGFQEGFIGLVITLCALLNMVTQPLLGYISETFVPSKYLVIGCCALSIPVGFMLPATISVPVVALTAVVLLSLLEYPVFPLYDVWTVRLSELCGSVGYGIPRGFGSIGYALSALIFGKVFVKVGIDSLFIIHGIILVVCIVLVCLVENVGCPNKAEKEQQNKENAKSTNSVSMGQALKLLIKNKKYVMFAFSYLLINIGMRFIGNFYPVLINLKGGDVGDLGVGTFLMSLSEVPFIFAFAKYSKRFSIEKIMLFALSMFTVRNVMMFLAPNVITLQLAQLTQGISFGVYVPAFMYYMRAITPENITTTAVTAVSSFIGAAASIVGTFFGGVMIEKIGAYPSILCCIVLSVVGALIFFISLFAGKKNSSSPDAVGEI